MIAEQLYVHSLLCFTLSLAQPSLELIDPWMVHEFHEVLQQMAFWKK